MLYFIYAIRRDSLKAFYVRGEWVGTNVSMLQRDGWEVYSRPAIFEWAQS